MPSFSDFAGFEGFLFYSVGAKRALLPDRGVARSPGAIPQIPLWSLKQKPSADFSADTIERSE
jgi:hypothetical protein